MSCLEPVRAWSDDEIERIHETALRVLETLGVRMLLAEARALLRDAGAEVDEGERQVRIPRGLVEAALATAPAEVALFGADASDPVVLGGRNVVWSPVGGPPHVSDLDRGRRPGTLADFETLVKLVQHFEVLHVQNVGIEAQDVDPRLRHLEVTRALLTLSDKAPFVFARGKAQVRDCFEMIRVARGLDEAGFRARPWVMTVVNTNSPLQLDELMLQGILDFARAGQLDVITPFTLAGAMAPVTLPGALAQQHAELLAGLVVSQLASPGAPVVYGGFTSNVDMRSGAPAFGTPEYVRAAWATGQLARRLGLPWRSSVATAGNAPDAQAAYESQMSLWGASLGGANLVLHAAGWLEGGLTASFEKLVIDVEMLRMMAELMAGSPLEEADLAFDAMAEVGPGGHFFAAAHTMERYRDAFYEPLVSDWSNFGRWTETGARSAAERANAIWKRVVAEFEPPPLDPARREALDEYVARRREEGGAPIGA